MGRLQQKELLGLEFMRLGVHWIEIRNHKLNSFAVKLAAVSVADTVRIPEYSSEVWPFLATERCWKAPAWGCLHASSAPFCLFTSSGCSYPIVPLVLTSFPVLTCFTILPLSSSQKPSHCVSSLCSQPFPFVCCVKLQGRGNLLLWLLLAHRRDVLITFKVAKPNHGSSGAHLIVCNPCGLEMRGGAAGTDGFSLSPQDCCVSYGGMWYLKGTVQSWRQLWRFLCFRCSPGWKRKPAVGGTDSNAVASGVWGRSWPTLGHVALQTVTDITAHSHICLHGRLGAASN